MQGLVYDYYVDEKSGAMVHWETRVPPFVYTPGNFTSLFVPTVETTRLTYFLDSLIANKHHVMFIGSTGAPAAVTDWSSSWGPAIARQEQLREGHSQVGCRPGFIALV